MTVLGIHTDVPTNLKSEEKTALKSHNWITLEKDGKLRDFALYPTDNKDVKRAGQEKGWDGSGTHVREGVDTNRTATASLYIKITPQQEQKLFTALSQPQKFSRTDNNCAHWATSTFEKSTGVRLEAKHEMGRESGLPATATSPVVVQKSIENRPERHLGGPHVPQRQELAPAPTQRQELAPSAALTRPPIRPFAALHPPGKDRDRDR